MDIQYVRVTTGTGGAHGFVDVPVPSNAILVAASIELRALGEGRFSSAGRYGACIGFYIPPRQYDTQAVCPFTLNRGARTFGGVISAFCSFVTDTGRVFADTHYQEDPPEIYYYCKPVPEPAPGLFEQPAVRLEEGDPLSILMTAFERSRHARHLCIQFHGCACLACGMDFGNRYGKEAANFIHVHHIEPISAIGQSHLVDPRKDLVPLCPNCHGVVHLRNPPYSVDEVRAMLACQTTPRRGAGL